MTSGVRQRSALQPRIDESDPVTKPTTLITRSATVALGAHQFSTDADSVTDSTSANDVARSGDETGPTEESTPPIDAGPTSEVASPPTTNEVQPSPTGNPPTDDPAPSPVASTEVTSDTAVPVIPVNDALGIGFRRVGVGPDRPSDTGVTTVLEALLTPTTEPVATPAVPVDVAPVLETIVNTVELMSDDENAQRRSDHDRPALSPLQILRLMTQTSGSSLAGEATEIPTLLDGSNQTRSNSAAFASGTNGALAGTSSTTPVVARIQPDAALPEGLQTFLHTYGGIIVAVSLSAMFAAALPGLIGLAIPVAAGMGIGYRQAKAGRALHTSGIAHLAPSGPIGVVRSGRLIALRSPGRRVPTPNNADLAQEVA